MTEKQPQTPEQLERAREHIIKEQTKEDGIIERHFANENNQRTRVEMIFPDKITLEGFLDAEGNLIKIIQREKLSENRISECYHDGNGNPTEAFIKDKSGNILQYENLKALNTLMEKMIILKAWEVKYHPEKIEYVIGMMDTE